jgi:hypothetical protein
MVLEPNQIKSATGNKGTFNPDSNKINESFQEAKDGDGDGLIDDGKPSEAPAEKRPEAEAKQLEILLGSTQPTAVQESHELSGRQKAILEAWTDYP